jgi:hypothetical protein
VARDVSNQPAELLGAMPAGEVDPELLALPDPPKRERTFTVVLLVMTAIASLAMVFALRHDAAYAFGAPAAVEIGDLRAAPAEALVENRYVRADGMLAAAGAIRYERPFESDSYRVSPVAGRPDLWVEVRVPAGSENARYVPPSHFTGRLLPFDRVGPRHRGLATAVRDATHEQVPAGAWLLVDGESPGSARWAVALVVLFGAFALWNVVAMARLLRRVA